MADETFGVSIIEAQASGLPVVGVAAGAMIDRVTDAVGRLGPVGDARAWPETSSPCGTPIGRKWREQARAHALQFGWERSMAALFGRIYPAAFARRAGIAVEAPAGAAVAA